MAFAPNTGRGAEAQALAELRTVAEATDARLEAFLAAEAERWNIIDPALVPPIESLEALVLNGGKRLRPAFCHWGHQAVTGAGVEGGGGSPTAALVDAGAALEMLHAFALAHDDVMDDSASRRGQPTTHVRHADQHRRAGWRGDPRRFGENVAILVGDLGHTYARRLIAAAPGPAQEVWERLESELMLGQYLDVAGTATGDVPIERATRIAQLKSGSYTVARPLQLGVALAGRTDVPEAIDEYGTTVGLAFQLRDDLLGVYGDSELTGKPVGEDLREGKPTPLVAIARQRATPAEAEVLADVGVARDAATVRAITEVLTSTGATAEVERLVLELTERGVEAISRPDAGVDEHTASVLAAFARVLGERSA